MIGGKAVKLTRLAQAGFRVPDGFCVTRTAADGYLGIVTASAPDQVGGNLVNRLRAEKLHVRLAEGVDPAGPVVPRCYTLTHSDRTGDLYLTIGSAHDLQQISGWYTRLMRDEVLAAWGNQGDGPALHVHCHVSGGLILGSPRWRDAILRHEMPLVLETLRYGDRSLYEACPELEWAPIRVHFHARQARYERVESWGVPADHR